MDDPRYRQLVDALAARGTDVAAVEAALVAQRIETPSWGYGRSGTRFGAFPQPGEPRTAIEKFEDAAAVQRATGVCPSVAIHIPWDIVDDWPGARTTSARRRTGPRGTTRGPRRRAASERLL